MRTIQIDIPDTIDLNEKEAKMFLAASLYEKGKFSLGQSAHLAGLSKRAFMETLSLYGVSVINHNPEDLRENVENAESFA